MSLTMGPQAPVESPTSGTVHIKEVRAYCVENRKENEGLAHPAPSFHEEDATIVVQVELNNGLKGIGVSQGGDAACFIVEKQLAKQVEGQDPSNPEFIWEKMFRLTLQYGRQGVVMHAISAIDLAIWDVLGKLRELPVYALLGGKTKEKLPVYATTLRPDLAKARGFHGAKIPLPHTPLEGVYGMNHIVDLIRKWRTVVGPDYPLMIQCNKTMNVPYAIALSKRCEGCNLKWIEEALPPTQYEGYARLKETVPTISWTTGKHKYTRYDFKPLLEQEACDILCLDVTTCGGLTEARKIVAMASAYDVSVVSHGSSSVYGYHLQMAFSNCQLGEYIMLQQNDNVWKGHYDSIMEGEPLPLGGYIVLASNKPGFGIQLRSGNKSLKRFNHPTRPQAAAAQNLAAPSPAGTSSVPTRATVPPNLQLLQQLRNQPSKQPAGVQNKGVPAKRTTNIKYGYRANPYTNYEMQPPSAKPRAVGFRRFLSTTTVDNLSYQEAGDWCKKVGISLGGKKEVRINRLKEYLKDKPKGYKQY